MNKVLSILFVALFLLCALTAGANAGDVSCSSAGDTMPADLLALAGLWHADRTLGSGFSTRLALNVDSTFLWAASEMDGLEPVRYRSGTWGIENGNLRLVIENEVRWEGGRETPAFGSTATETEIVDAEIVFVYHIEPLTEVYELGDIETDLSAMSKKTVVIGGVQYWELAHPIDLETLYEDFAAIEGQASRMVGEPAAAGNHPDGETDRGLPSRLADSIWLDSESETVLMVGSTCLFREDEKESVPYRWRYSISDESIIGFVYSDYEMSAESRPIPGGDAGWRRFYFEALSPGACEITFRYGRYGGEWDEEWDEEISYSVVVTAE